MASATINGEGLLVLKLEVMEAAELCAALQAYIDKTHDAPTSKADAVKIFTMIDNAMMGGATDG